MVILKIENITKSFPKKKNGYLRVLNEINVNLRKGEIISVLGPSGCGKTTLLNIIAGLLLADKGTVSFFGEGSEFLGYIMQKDLLLHWRTTLGNILLGLEIQNKVNKKKHVEIKSYLDNFGLDGYSDYYPNQLSGGMRQRVSLIRTLICDPEIILLDEPFANIDYKTRLDLEENIVKYIKPNNKSAIFVTHDIEEAVSVGDKVLILGPKPSDILYEVPIEETEENIRNPTEFRKTEKFKKYYNEILEKFNSVF